MISLLWMLQKGGSFKGRIAARRSGSYGRALGDYLCVFFYINWTSLLLYERKERVLLYFIVERIEGSFF